MRKICVVTGTRAEYGLLYWLMKKLQESEESVLQVIVSGMHLSSEFGLTYKTIEQDGFYIDAKVEMLLASDTPVGISKSIGLGVIGFAEALERLKPDILVVLGDRFEMLAAVQAALIARIPVAHLHGGELTEGLIDEAIRHSITKMSQLHFTSTEKYRQRVIQMGELPERVYNVGAIGLDNIDKLSLLNRAEFEKRIDFSLGEITFLITFHPVTLKKNESESSLRNLLKAIDLFPEANIIFTKGNADTEGRVLNQIIDEYVSENKKRTIAFMSMGQLLYLSAIKNVNIVIGNSSSGIIEAPYMKRAVINIGDRQKGRIKARSVIDCKEDIESIVNAIKLALSPKFKKVCLDNNFAYGSGNVTDKIVDVLKKVSLENLVEKKFYDINL